ncbi:hypothetical protein V8E54_014271 [Elaphomyces granulatus]
MSILYHDNPREKLISASNRTMTPFYLSSTCKTFFLNEIKERDREIEDDDTSGREIRHGEYFRQLDELRERLAIVQATGKSKKKPTEQAAAKELTRENLQRSYGNKRRAESVVSLTSSVKTIRPQKGALLLSAKWTRLRLYFGEDLCRTLRWRPKNQKNAGKKATRSAIRTTVDQIKFIMIVVKEVGGMGERFVEQLIQKIRLFPHLELLLCSRGHKRRRNNDIDLSHSIGKLAHATENGASELAAAMRHMNQDMPSTVSGETTSLNTEVREMVGELREETTQRLDALERRAEEREASLERRAEEREVARDERILQILGQLMERQL